MVVLTAVAVVVDQAVVLGPVVQGLEQQARLDRDIMALVVGIVLVVVVALLEQALSQTVVRVLNGQRVLDYTTQVVVAEQVVSVELAVAVVVEYHMAPLEQLIQVAVVVLDNLQITQLVEVAVRVLLYCISHHQLILEQQQLVHQLSLQLLLIL
jgi:hypothetical protein